MGSEEMGSATIKSEEMEEMGSEEMGSATIKSEEMEKWGQEMGSATIKSINRKLIQIINIGYAIADL